LRSRGAR
jgi:hypothetical protein